MGFSWVPLVVILCLPLWEILSFLILFLFRLILFGTVSERLH